MRPTAPTGPRRKRGPTIETPLGYRRDWAVGETGSGKSRFATLLAEQWAHAGGEVWCLDLLDVMPVSDGIVHIVPDQEADLETHGPFYDFVNAWASAAFDHVRDTGKPLLFVLDETDLAVRRGDAPPGLVRLVMQGRKHGLSYVFCTRRPVEISSTLRSQVDNLYCFRMREPRDLEAVAGRGLDFSDVSTLPVGQFYHLGGMLPPHKHATAFAPCA